MDCSFAIYTLNDNRRGGMDKVKIVQSLGEAEVIGNINYEAWVEDDIKLGNDFIASLKGYKTLKHLNVYSLKGGSNVFNSPVRCDTPKSMAGIGVRAQNEIAMPRIGRLQPLKLEYALQLDTTIDGVPKCVVIRSERDFIKARNLLMMKIRNIKLYQYNNLMSNLGGRTMQ